MFFDFSYRAQMLFHKKFAVLRFITICSSVRKKEKSSIKS
jgi:hypothetical protein